MARGRTLFSILFSAPAFIMFAMFMVFPVIFSGYLSLTKWNGAGIPEFIRFDNFIKLFKNVNYWRTVKNTGILMLLSLLIKIPFGFLLAYLMLKVKKGFRYYRTMFFIPVVIAPVAIGLMFTLIYNSEMGILNGFLDFLGLGSLRQNWLSNTKIVIYSVSLPQVWQYIGTFFIIFLAAMLSIPKEIFENAELEGAKPLRVMFSIIIPMIWRVVEIAIVLAITGSLKEFEHPWVMTEGGPGWASSYISLYMFKQAFQSHLFGYASSVTITILSYALGLTLLLRWFTSRRKNMDY